MSERLLRRIGLDEAPSADAEGLRIAHRAFVSSVAQHEKYMNKGKREVGEDATS